VRKHNAPEGSETTHLSAAHPEILAFSLQPAPSTLPSKVLDNLTQQKRGKGEGARVKTSEKGGGIGPFRRVDDWEIKETNFNGFRYLISNRKSVR
jgi:hypothetical protein